VIGMVAEEDEAWLRDFLSEDRAQEAAAVAA
jgi:hypothetical protein